MCPRNLVTGLMVIVPICGTASPLFGASTAIVQTTPLLDGPETAMAAGETIQTPAVAMSASVQKLPFESLSFSEFIPAPSFEQIAVAVGSMEVSIASNMDDRHLNLTGQLSAYQPTGLDAPVAAPATYQRDFGQGTFRDYKPEPAIGASNLRAWGYLPD